MLLFSHTVSDIFPTLRLFLNKFKFVRHFYYIGENWEFIFKKVWVSSSVERREEGSRKGRECVLSWLVQGSSIGGKKDIFKKITFVIGFSPVGTEKYSFSYGLILPRPGVSKAMVLTVSDYFPMWGYLLVLLQSLCSKCVFTNRISLALYLVLSFKSLKLKSQYCCQYYQQIPDVSKVITTKVQVGRKSTAHL